MHCSKGSKLLKLGYFDTVGENSLHRPESWQVIRVVVRELSKRSHFLACTHGNTVVVRDVLKRGTMDVNDTTSQACEFWKANAKDYAC